MYLNRRIILFSSIIISGCGYQNYEECLLGEMKGQDYSMSIIAEKLCERKFPYEKEIASTGGWKFGWGISDSSVILKIKSNKSDYKITKAIMKFSNKQCSVAKDWGVLDYRKSDFTEKLTFDFDNSKQASVVSFSAINFKCMITDSVYGVMRNE